MKSEVEYKIVHFRPVFSMECLLYDYYEHILNTELIRQNVFNILSHFENIFL